MERRPLNEFFNLHFIDEDQLSSTLTPTLESTVSTHPFNSSASIFTGSLYQLNIYFIIVIPILCFVVIVVTLVIGFLMCYFRTHKSDSKQPTNKARFDEPSITDDSDSHEDMEMCVSPSYIVDK